MSLTWRWQLSAFLAAIVLVVSRRPDAVFGAQFFAEDASYWFGDAYNLGWLHAVVLPHNGYFQTLPRLAASLALLFPLHLAPLVMNLVGITSQVLPAFLLLSSRCHGWAPFPARAAMAVLYLAIPCSEELDATVTGAQWHVALAACLIVVSAPPATWKWRIFDTAVLLACGLTGPFCLMLAPLAGVFWWLCRHPWRLAVFGLLASSAVVQFYALLHTAALTRSAAPLGATFGNLVQLLGGQVFIGALVGENPLATHNEIWAWWLLGCSFVTGLAVILYCGWRARAEQRLWLAFACLVTCASLKYPMVKMQGPQWQALKTEPATRYWLFAMLALVSSLIWCLGDGRPRFVRIGSAVLLALMSCGIVRDWRHEPYDNVGFAPAAARFEAAPAGTRVIIPAYPRRWYTELIKRSPSCGIVPFGAIQDPPAWSTVPGKTVLAGYALAGRPLSHLSLYIDGRFQTTFVPDRHRADVDGGFPTFPGRHKGFALPLDASAWTPGWHEIKVRAFIPGGCEADIDVTHLGH